MSANASHPITLVLDVQRQIFELAACTDPESIPGLMLVSRRVRKWVQPLLCRIVVLVDPAGRRALHGRTGYPLKDNHGFTRTLSTQHSLFVECTRQLCLLLVPVAVLRHVLSPASNVENLWILPDINHSQLAHLFNPAMQLKRLHCRLAPSDNPINFARLSFSQLTHLELMGYENPLPAAVQQWLPLLSSLTHLAFSDNHLVVPLSDFLRVRPAFRALIYKIWGKIIPPNRCPSELRADVRFVQLACEEYIKDWHTGALTGVDFWSRADDFIAKRRSGKYNQLNCVMEGDGSLGLP